MKTILRIGIILLLALIVVGATMAVTNSSSTQTATFEEGQRPQMSDDGSFTPGQRPEGGHGGEHGGGSSLGWVRHLLVISGIMFVVVVIEWSWKRISKPRLVQAS